MKSWPCHQVRQRSALSDAIPESFLCCLSTGLVLTTALCFSAAQSSREGLQLILRVSFSNMHTGLEPRPIQMDKYLSMPVYAWLYGGIQGIRRWLRGRKAYCLCILIPDRSNSNHNPSWDLEQATIKSSRLDKIM